MLTSYSTKKLVKVNGKVIGWLEVDTFYKSVAGSRHKLRKPSAWAIDAEAFDREVMPIANKIVIIDKETDIEYHTSVDTFNRFKGELDRGFGKQYYLTLAHWQTKDNGHRQLGLWEGHDN